VRLDSPPLTTPTPASRPYPRPRQPALSLSPRVATSSECDAPAAAGALVPWIRDALLSNHYVKAYGRDLADFVRHRRTQGVTPQEIAASLKAALELFGAIANELKGRLPHVLDRPSCLCSWDRFKS
jgi:hypothetical protein